MHPFFKSIDLRQNEKYIIYGLLLSGSRLMTQTKWVETGVSSTVRQQTCNIDGSSSAKYLQSVLIKASIL